LLYQKIRQQAKDENQVRFEQLLKRQEQERNGLKEKLKLEKKALLVTCSALMMCFIAVAGSQSTGLCSAKETPAQR